MIFLIHSALAVFAIALLTACAGGDAAPVAGGGGRGAISVVPAGQSAVIVSSATTPFAISGTSGVFQVDDTVSGGASNVTLGAAVVSTPDYTTVSNGGCLSLLPRSIVAGGEVIVHATGNAGCRYPLPLNVQFSDTTGSTDTVYFTVSP